FMTEGSSPFVGVANRVKPTVVNITAERKVGGVQMWDPFDFFENSPFWDFFHRPQERPKRERSFRVPSSGTGIIIGQDGYILTNNHMVQDAVEVRVKLANGGERKAEIIGTDPETDVALIRIDAKLEENQVAVLGNSDEIQIGDWAIAVGNPLGLDWTVTVGVISAKGRTNLPIQGGGPSYQDFIQTDASINFGNSGGPLCNIKGEVIGMNTAINPSGQGIGFAIPINLAMKVVDQLKTSGKVARGYLGMMPRELTPELREASGLDKDVEGIFVERVDPKTPAEEGGLEAGDIVTEVDGKPVKDVTQFRMDIADHAPKSKVALKVLRDGKEKVLNFTLANRGDYASRLGIQEPAKPEEEDEPFLGIRVEELTPSNARSLNLEEDKGVVITQVDPDGPSRNKLREGDVIIKIDRNEINNMSDYRKVVKNLKGRKEAILFRIIRNGVKTFEAVEPE
ncbi:MAG: Do family serine endopeptidase, partial [Calditrichaeota bacterium]|nr:Do family serine endopeptidase [Calditrichota bacterium]